MIDIEEIANGSMITDILSRTSLPLLTVKKGYKVYPTPFRESHSPTLIVTDMNTWCDTGMKDEDGQPMPLKGDVVDFVVVLDLAKGHTDSIRFLDDFRQGRIPYVDVSGGLSCMERIRKNPFHMTSGGNSTSIGIQDIKKEITDPSLLQFLMEEDIDSSVASYFLQEATIEQGRYVRSEDPALLLGTQNGSYLSFTPLETKFIGTASMSIFRGYGEYSCTIFTHLFDFLRYLSYGVVFGSDVVVMNHFALLPSALEFGKRFGKTTFFLRENRHAKDIWEHVSQTIPACHIELIKNINYV